MDVSALQVVKARSPKADLGRFPDFLIAGPQRTGTTWIYRNLLNHPHIFLPPTKELYYFSTLGKPHHQHYQFDYLEDYLGVFNETVKARVKKTYDCARRCLALYEPKILGESTATYATLKPAVIQDLALLNPALKIILMLRDPIDRAWSHAKKEILRIAPSGSILSDQQIREFFLQDGQMRRSAMVDVVAQWRASFPVSQVFLGDYEQLATAPVEFLQGLCEFLGTPLPVRFDSPHLKNRVNATTRDALPAGTREWLEKHFESDVASYRRLVLSARATRISE